MEEKINSKNNLNEDEMLEIKEEVKFHENFYNNILFILYSSIPLIQSTKIFSFVDMG